MALTPNELIETIDQVIESLVEYEEDCYAAVDIAYTLKEEVLTALEMFIDYTAQ
ncbi:MAG: hypothetical protein ACXW2E_01900 [Nitrososphaeraceae archaeon]